ncbi:carboxypeptidase-like regulatory domain-containing protein [Niabella defluvii]|nr:carboxypeptidase-like regulatory domain-containing protein [Niabella sp. I65]
MKLSLILLCLALQVSATNYGQTISLKRRACITNRDLQKIEKKSPYRFYFSSDVLPQKHFTSVYADKASLEDVMGKILAGVNLSWKQLSGNRIVIAENTPVVTGESPIRTITGIVTDNTGAPLENVSIVIKGTATGVTTSATGRFSINATEGDVLVFSRVGYQEQEITIAAQDTIELVLQATQGSLTEVVVVG